MLVSRLAYSWTMKIEAMCFSEMSVEFLWTARRVSKETEHFIITTVRTSNSKRGRGYSTDLPTSFPLKTCKPLQIGHRYQQ
jgi:hypothetical protein